MISIIHVLALILFFAITGCTSTGGVEQPEFEVTTVLERIGGNDETPEWATGESALAVEKGDVISIGIVRVDGDARTDACMNVAAENGRMAILRQIQDNISNSGQLNDDNISSDPSYESLMMFLAQGKLNGVKVVRRYWEKRVESDSSGQRVLKLSCAVKVGISRSLLDKQIKAAINGGRSGNPEIRERLNESHKSFIDNVGRTASEAAH
jgi:hypothetical protein